MFGLLFEDDGLPAGPNTSPVRLNGCAPSIPEHRGATNLCGLENLGATCYLNSLIQTLLFTPEFREGLMQLHLEPSSEGNKIRVIPLELQKLFSQLLLLDVASVSTCQLTESFGWTDHEELYQQQDVQELIRILFFAIQKSLVGTPGHDLISRLYQGTTVSQVQCQSCEFISVRDESYLDLTVAVGQNKTLKSSLYAAYVEAEPMTGSNQYLCPTCNTLTDANKVVKLRHLPPILTLSLLRFLYDPVQHQRFKDESRLEFPLELDMSPFCEQPQPSEVTMYELLSVIVHRGGAHGGHYHAIIQDIDSLGQWDVSEQVPNANYAREMGFPTPELLISDILEEQQDSTLSLEQLLEKIYERIGIPWSKSYKSKYGSINQFLNSHCSHFFVEGSELQATVTLIGDLKSVNMENGDDKPSPSHRGRQWFNFNDMEVLPVNEEDMEKFFEGEESAYMLVYRRKSLQRPEAAVANPAYAIPLHIQDWVDQVNQQNEAERERAHLIWIRILPRSGYSIYQRNMIASEDKRLELELTIDERESLSTFKRRAKEKIAEEMYGEYGATEWNTFQWVHQSGFNLAIQDPVPDSESISLEEYKVENGQAFLAWNCDTELDMENTPTEENWEYASEYQQPINHCAVVHNTESSGLEYSVSAKNIEDGSIVKLSVTPNMTVGQVRNLVEWQMGLSSEAQASMTIRLGEDIHALEPPLQDHLSMEDASIKPDTLIFVDTNSCGKIEPHQVWLSFVLDDTNSNKDPPMFLLMDSDATVGFLLDQMLKKADVDDDEAWHIGKTSMSGDVIQTLKNPQATLQSENIIHGSHLVLRRGLALQHGLTRIKIMEASSFVVPCPSKAPKISSLGYIDVDTEAANLSDLKNKVIALLEENKQQQYPESHIRIRFFSKALSRVGRILKDHHLSLRSMEIAKNTPLVVEILSKEENLRNTDTVLQVWRHIPGGCTYTGPNELVWDQAATSLAEAVASSLDIEQKNLVIAKYQPKAHRWNILPIQEDNRMIIDEQEKENDIYTLFSLNDGDILGVKDSSKENGDLQNFTTSSDLERWLRMEEEKENQQRSNEAAAAVALEWTAAQAQSRIPERGIHIHVSDFC